MKLKIKNLISRIICSNIIGNIIGYYFNNNIPYFHDRELYFDCSPPQIKGIIKAQIFFGIYESAEYRFCIKYIENNSLIIELGSSIGLISTIVSKNKNPSEIIAIEANPFLIDVMQRNFNLNGIKKVKIINKAICNELGNKFWFCFGSDNTTGFISNESSINSIPVRSTNLSELLKSNKDQIFTLICDIEGAEVDIIYNDVSALANCKLMIIELHEVTYNKKKYYIDEMIQQIFKIGFKQIDRYGNSFVFLNSHI